MNTKHGIVTNCPPAQENVRILFVPPFSSLADLCAFGVETGFTHLWILPGVGIDPTVEWVQQARGQWDLKACTWEHKNAPKGAPNHLRSLYTFRDKSLNAVGPARNSINIIFCAEYAAWEWARLPSLTAPDALGMLQWLEDVLQVPVSGSPGNTGYTYLTQVEAKNKNWFEKPYTTTDHVGFAAIPWDKAVHFVMWPDKGARKPTPEELNRPYLVKIDKNGAFPRAAVDEKQGVGRVRCLPGHKALALWDDPDFDVKTPGIWKILVRRQPPFSLMFPRIKSGWLPTSMVRAARSLGYRLECEQAWLFERGEYLLKKTMQQLWAIRSTPGLPEEKRGAIKQIMNDLPGYFHNESLGPDNPKYRPDIYAGVTGGNFALMLQNMEKFADTFKLFPLISHMDCLVYASDKPLADLMPDNRTSLGGYKHEWQLEMTDEIRAILQHGNSANQLMKLNALAAVQAEEAEARRLVIADNYAELSGYYDAL